MIDLGRNKQTVIGFTYEEPMNISFERATVADAEDLVKAQIAAFHHDSLLYPGLEIGGPPGYDSVEAMRKKIGEDECYKIVDAGQIIGGIVVFDMGQRHYHLDLIFIDPAHHNRGIGTCAIQFIEQTYPAKQWSLDTPSWAIRNQHFYEKLGYVKVKEETHPEIILFGYEKQIG
jgi:RimJ/RimL family protein N-acetyltransferase